MDYQDYMGFYNMLGFQMNLLEVEGQLVAAVPGVPAGFEILLEPLTPGDRGVDRFRMRGGPMDGSIAEFLRGEDGTVRAAQVEAFELARLTPEQAAELPIVKRLIASPLVLPPEKKSCLPVSAGGTPCPFKWWSSCLQSALPKARVCAVRHGPGILYLPRLQQPGN